MKCFKLFLLALVLMSSGGCIDEMRDQEALLNYDQAVELAKQYLRISGYYKDNETVYMYDPKCSFWHSRYSGSPEKLREALKTYGITNENYSVVLFAGESAYTRDGGATVFIDRSEKRVIGVLYDNGNFVKNEIK